MPIFPAFIGDFVETLPTTADPGKTIARLILLLIRAQNVESSAPGSIMVEFAEKTLARALNERLG